MRVFRLEHVLCPEGEGGHGPYIGPKRCTITQTFGRAHANPSHDVLQPPRHGPCVECSSDGDWCWKCDGEGVTEVVIGRTDEQVCGVTRKQFPLWVGVSDRPILRDGWKIVEYEVDGRRRYTRRGRYQVVFRREDAKVIRHHTGLRHLLPEKQYPKIIDTRRGLIAA